MLTILLLAQLFIAVVAHAASITLAWSFNYAVDPACTATLTKNCVIGFEYGTTPDGGKTLVKVGTVANPTSAAGSTNVTAQFTQGPPYGSVVYYARTSGLDGNGNVVFSAVAISAATQITPAAPSNLVITVQ